MPGCLFVPEKPKAGLESVCHHDDYSGRHRLNRPDSDPLRTRPGRRRREYRLYQRNDCFSPGVAALISAPRLGKLGDRIGPEKILIVALMVSVLLLIPMSFVQTPLQLAILRFLLGAADGAAAGRPDAAGVQLNQPVAGRILAITSHFAISATSPAH